MDRRRLRLIKAERPEPGHKARRGGLMVPMMRLGFRQRRRGGHAMAAASGIERDFDFIDILN